MRRSAWGTIAAIALAALVIYFVVLPMMKKGKGAVIVSRGPSGGSSSSQQGSSRQLSGDLRDYGGGEWEGWLTRMDKTIAEMYPAAPLPGSRGPYIRAVNIRYDPQQFNDRKGWYYIQVKACYASKNCGCGDKVALLGPYNFTKGIHAVSSTGGLPIMKGWNPYPTTGGRQIEVVVVPLTESIVLLPEESPLTWLHSFIDDVTVFAVDHTGRNRGKVNFYLARAYLEQILPKCEHKPTDELQVYSRLLWAPPSSQPPNIDKFSAVTKWELQAAVQIDFGPHAGESPEVSENYANGGVEFVSVNGYVNMIMWPQSPFQPPTVVNMHLVAATVAFLTISALIIWWRLRR